MHKSRLCSVRCAVLGRHKHIQVARKVKIDGQSLKRDLQSVDSSLTVQTRASAGGRFLRICMTQFRSCKVSLMRCRD